MHARRKKLTICVALVSSAVRIRVCPRVLAGWLGGWVYHDVSGLGWGDAGKVVAITARDRKALVSLIESYGDKALRAVGLAHKDIKAADATQRTDLLKPEDLEHDLVLDAIVVSFSFFAHLRTVLMRA